MEDENTQNTKVLLKILIGLILIFVSLLVFLRSGMFHISTSTVIARSILQVLG